MELIVFPNGQTQAMDNSNPLKKLNDPNQYQIHCYLIPDYLLGSGLTPLTTFYVFKMCYRIVVKMNLHSRWHKTVKKMLRIQKRLVVEFMYDLLEYVTNGFIKIRVEEYFLVMFPTRTNSLSCMTKIWKGSKLLLTQSLMKDLMIVPSIIYHQIVKIFVN